jgi:regulator of RNase E activity RraA
MEVQFSTADLFDAFEARCSSCETQFKQYGGRRMFPGRIRTVQCLNDNALLRRILETASDGEVLASILASRLWVRTPRRAPRQAPDRSTSRFHSAE